MLPVYGIQYSSPVDYATLNVHRWLVCNWKIRRKEEGAVQILTRYTSKRNRYSNLFSLARNCRRVILHTTYSWPSSRITGFLHRFSCEEPCRSFPATLYSKARVRCEHFLGWAGVSYSSLPRDSLRIHVFRLSWRILSKIPSRNVRCPDRYSNPAPPGALRFQPARSVAGVTVQRETKYILSFPNVHRKSKCCIPYIHKLFFWNYRFITIQIEISAIIYIGYAFGYVKQAMYNSEYKNIQYGS